MTDHSRYFRGTVGILADIAFDAITQIDSLADIDNPSLIVFHR